MNHRPPSVAEILDHIAAHLDAADVIVNRYAELTGSHRRIHGDGVQNDLRALAVWLREHPKTDAWMYDHLPTQPEGETDGHVPHRLHHR